MWNCDWPSTNWNRINNDYVMTIFAYFVVLRVLIHRNISLQKYTPAVLVVYKQCQHVNYNESHYSHVLMFHFYAKVLHHLSRGGSHIDSFWCWGYFGVTTIVSHKWVTMMKPPWKNYILTIKQLNMYRKYHMQKLLYFMCVSGHIFLWLLYFIFNLSNFAFFPFLIDVLDIKYIGLVDIKHICP